MAIKLIGIATQNIIASPLTTPTLQIHNNTRVRIIIV